MLFAKMSALPWWSQLIDATLYLNWQDGVFGYDSQHEH